MKASFLFSMCAVALLAGACSSGGGAGETTTGSGGGGARTGACAAASALGLPVGACQTCEANACSGALSAVSSACADSLSCMCACPAGDAACEASCAPAAGCQSAVSDLGSCVGTQCAANCGRVAGAGDGGAGSPAPTLGGGAGGYVGPSCPAGGEPTTLAPPGASADCQKCAASCVTASDFAGACAGYSACYCPCAVGDSSCQEACVPLEDGECATAEMQVTTCVDTECTSLCGTCETPMLGTYQLVGAVALAAGQNAACPPGPTTIMMQFAVANGGGVFPQLAGCNVTASSPCSTTVLCPFTAPITSTLTPASATTFSANVVETAPTWAWGSCAYTATYRVNG